jgi:transglutaminase-like putative cysteine protease
MTLRQLRDRLSAVHCALAGIAVALGGGVEWWSLALAAALTAWAFVRPLPEEPSPASQRLWTLGIVVALVGTVARAFVRAEFLDAGVDFLLLLIVQRMFNRQRAREHLQLLGLSTLLIVVAAVINAGLNFPLLFAGYLVVAVMTLIVNHLLSEGERLGRRVQVEVARAGIRSRRNLWRAAISVATIAGTGALVVFLVFPRWGAGVFFRGNLARRSQSGFSGNVELGGFGRIKTDPTVVARLRPKTPMAPVPQVGWYLRGSSLDVYESGRWTHSREGEISPLEALGPYRTFSFDGHRMLQVTSRGPGRNRTYAPYPIPGFSASQEQLSVQVILEDIGVDVLFAASEPLAVRTQPRGSIERQVKVRGGFNRELRADKPPGPIQYEFVSRIGLPTPDELEAVGNPTVGPKLQTFIQRSEGLSPGVTKLAEEITRGTQSRQDKVAAVLEYLGEFAYTTDLTLPERVRQGADPIEGFLFDTKAGHCEYFATAMAVLLREVGVPTRIVNGYYGAQYNQLGDFYAVRQADAHSWVEVHFGSLGWVTFDPTPPVGRTAGDDVGLFPGVNQAFDAMRNAYLEYVIDYNLTKQLSLLEGLGMRRDDPQYGRSRVDWKGVGMWFLGFGVAGLAITLWRRRTRGPPEAPEVRLYGSLLRRFAARGHPRLPSESARRYADRLAGQGVPGGKAFRTFARLYEDLRFGRGATPEDRRKLAAAADEVLSQMRGPS